MVLEEKPKSLALLKPILIFLITSTLGVIVWPIGEGKNKIILDDAGGQGVVPYLPLNELKKGNSN